MNVVKLASERAQAAGGGWLPTQEVEELASQAKTSLEQLMLDLIPLAATFARPPLSRFHVGAVAQGTSGALYFGANLELPSCPLSQTVHAEQATVVNAAIHQETGLERLALSAAPCGHCRQFLWELATAAKLQILLAGQAPQLLRSLLPGAFGPADLDLEGRLLGSARHHLQWASTAPGTVAAEAALQAAQSSYAPYTGALGGVALRMSDGRTFAGPYLENAAFNPSLPPLQAAIIAAGLAGTSVEMVVEAVVVQQESSKVDHTAATCFVLETLAPNAVVYGLKVRVA